MHLAIGGERVQGGRAQISVPVPVCVLRTVKQQLHSPGMFLPAAAPYFLFIPGNSDMVEQTGEFSRPSPDWDGRRKGYCYFGCCRAF